MATVLYYTVQAPKRGLNLLQSIVDMDNNGNDYWNVKDYISGTTTVNQALCSVRKVYIIANSWNSVMRVIKARIAKASSLGIELDTQVFIGDVIQCKCGFIPANSWEDIQCFSDYSIMKAVEMCDEDIRYRYNQLLKYPAVQQKFAECHSNFEYFRFCIEDELKTASDELLSYDLDTDGQLVAYLKMNVWHNGDKDTPYADPHQAIVHIEERIKYTHQITFYDVLLNWTQLQFYRQAGIQPMRRVYCRDGWDMVVPDSACDIDTYQLESTPIWITLE